MREEREWIDRSAVSLNLEVTVGAGSVTRVPDTGDRLSLLHPLATLDEIR